MVNETQFEAAYFREKKFAKTENKYLKALVKLSDKIEYLSQNKSEQRKGTAVPQIKIPTFSGNYEKWEEFKNIFEKIVHENNSLSNIEKMQYLKTHVTADATRVIQYF